MIYENYIDIPNWILTTPDDCKANIILDLIKAHLTSRNLKFDLRNLQTAIHVNCICSSVSFKIDVEKYSIEEINDIESDEEAEKVITVTPITIKPDWIQYSSKKKKQFY